MLPTTLTQLPNWVLWKGNKIPFQTNGQPAKSNDPTTWTTYEAVVAGKNGSSGIGFMLGDGIFGIDLDACLLDGEIAPWAAEILDQFRTYSEISPSGTGIKLFGLGKLPGGGKKKAIDAPPIGDRKPGIEVYGKGRYFTVTGDQVGDVAEVADCQAALDALHARLWPPAAAYVATPRTPMDATDRARRYLERVPPAVSGSGGHNHTFRVACVLVLGFRLSPESAYPVIAEWNATCQPPWRDSELWHKLGDADKLGGERGWLLDDRGYFGPDVELRHLLDSLAVPEVEAEPEQTQPVNSLRFPQDCIDSMPWLMRLAYDWILATAIKPQPELTLGAMIAMFGAVFGRKVRDDYGTRTNVMILALSPSGSGKEHPRQCVKEILRLAELDSINGPERIGSHAGIVSSVAAHPTRLFQLDEIGRLLATMRDPKSAPHLYNIGTVLMALYSSSNTSWTGDAYADLQKVKRVNQPHVCVFGTTVPDSFYSSITPDNLSDGLLGRMLVMEAGGYSNRRKPAIADPPAELIDAIKWWKNYHGDGGNMATENPVPRMISKTPEANERHEQYCNEVHNKHHAEGATEASVWARGPEKEAKLALIYACCGEGLVQTSIDLAAVNWGRKIANYSIRMVLERAQNTVSESRWEAEKKKLWRRIVDGMTASQLTRKTQWLHTRERNEIISELAECGAIRIDKEATKTFPKMIIRKLRNTP
jgi:hypothetical protein